MIKDGLPHMKLRKNEQGFSAVEALLVLIFVAILVVAGAVVYNANKRTNDTQHTTTSQDSTNSTSQTQTTTKYLDITEWEVKLPQPSDDTLQYTNASDDSVVVVSKNLSDQYGCTDEGAGMIKRWKTGETEDSAGLPVPTVVATVGDYSYGFAHDNGACSDSVPVSAQNAANDATKAQLSQLKADS